jgi:dihydroorotase
MNPPLRSKRDVDGLREYLKQGKIDWIETDHAPHTIGEKLHDGYPSGYPSLYLYKYCIEKFLPELGLTKNQIKNLTFNNIVKAFGI